MKKVLLTLVLSFISLCCVAQGERKWASSDYDFVLYLIDNDLKQDALFLLNNSSYHPSDTLDFLRGWTDYQLKDLPGALESFSKLDSCSPFYEKALFYSVAMDAHLGRYNSALSRLSSYKGPKKELESLQGAGLALLRDDPEGFSRSSQNFTFADQALYEPEKILSDIYKKRYETPQKSPLLAAAASAVVPGLGKIYAGRTGEGVSSFLITGALGAITAEHWIKDGPKDWKTIVSGLACAVFYIGNIYGSYVSVSISNQNLRDAQETVILYNIHIPLRSVFN